MEIKLNDEEIKNAMSNSITSAVTKSIQSYDVEKVIKEKVTNSVLNIAITETINNALLQPDMANLSKIISREFEKAVVSLAVTSIREVIVKVVYELRKGSKYMTSEEEKKEYEKIKFEMQSKEE